MICKNCQKEIKDTAKFCNFCGESQVVIQNAAYSNKRFFNLLLDSLILRFLVAYPAGYALGVILLVCGVQPGLLKDQTVINILTILIYVTYYSVFEYFFGKTPAKFITRTKVVTLDGDKPSFSHILKRSLIRLIPIEWISFFGHYPIGWHDKWSGTQVVDSNTNRKAR
jgi:uncharacterized RDD family membrane protein YckC